MKKSKVTMLTVLMALCMVVCTACSNNTLTGKIGSDGKCEFTTTTLMEKETTDVLLNYYLTQMGDDEESKQMVKEIQNLENVVVDGKTYYKAEESKKFNSYKEAENYVKGMDASLSGVSITKDHFYAYMSQDSVLLSNQDMNNTLLVMLVESGLTNEQITQMQDDMVMNFSITFEQPVTFSNGTVSGNEVSWTFKAAELEQKKSVQLYAETTEKSTFENDKTAPSISGVKNNGYYNKVKLNITDTGVGIAGIVLDKNTQYVFENSSKVSMSSTSFEEGNRKVTVYDFAGNKRVVSFTYDKTKPTIKGVSNNKVYKKACTITFSDKYGVKSAKLNGKTIKNKKKVSKNGSYTLKVTDKAGNTNTVKFKIKK